MLARESERGEVGKMKYVWSVDFGESRKERKVRDEVR